MKSVFYFNICWNILFFYINLGLFINNFLFWNLVAVLVHAILFGLAVWWFQEKNAKYID
jgi:hypothetical protein